MAGAAAAAADWGTRRTRRQHPGLLRCASRGRRWRDAPTATLSSLVAQESPHARDYADALAEVASPPAARRADDAGHRQRVRRRRSPAVDSHPRVVLGSSTAGGPASSEHVSPVREGDAPASADGTASAPRPRPEQPQKGVDELLAELDALIGLQREARSIGRSPCSASRSCADAGLKTPTMTRHLVFTGNPGTGKTTVARLVSGIYRALGLLARPPRRGRPLRAGRGIPGPDRDQDRRRRRLGGGRSAVHRRGLQPDGERLPGDQYGQESVDTLVKEMEDRRDDLVVIVAGYPAPMEAFIGANPGLASRFRTTIEFEDYTDDELVAILKHLAGRGLRAAARGRRAVPRGARPHPRDGGFGNGRFARNALEAAIGHHAWRLREIDMPTVDQLRQWWPGTSTRSSWRREPPPRRPRLMDYRHLRTRTPATAPLTPEASRDHPHAPGDSHPTASDGTGALAARPAGRHTRCTFLQPRGDNPAGSGGIHPGIQGRLEAVRVLAARRPCRHAGRLRALGALTVLAALLFGLAAGQAFRSADGALERAAANSDRSCGSRRSRPTSSRPTPTRPTRFSSAVWSRRPSARTTPRRSRPRHGSLRRPLSTSLRTVPLSGAQPVAHRLRQRDRAGPGEQPPGPPDRGAVPQGRQCQPALRRPATAEEPRRRQQRARRRGVRPRRTGVAVAGGPRRAHPARPGARAGVAGTPDPALRQPPAGRRSPDRAGDPGGRRRGADRGQETGGRCP